MVIISDPSTIPSLNLVESALAKYTADFGESNFDFSDGHVILQFRRTTEGLGIHGIEIPVTAFPQSIAPTLYMAVPDLKKLFFVRYLYDSPTQLTLQGFEGATEGKINRFDATGVKVDTYDLQPVLEGTSAFQYVRVSHHDYLYYNFSLGSKDAVFEALKSNIPADSYSVMEKDFNDLIKVFGTVTVGIAYKGPDMYSYYMLGIPSTLGKVLDSVPPVNLPIEEPSDPYIANPPPVPDVITIVEPKKE